LAQASFGSQEKQLFAQAKLNANGKMASFAELCDVRNVWHSLGGMRRQ